MPLVLANAKKADILEGGRAYLNSLDMRVFVSNITPTGTVMPVAGTDEPADGGYAVVPNPYPNAAATVGTVGRAVGITQTYVWAHDAGDFTGYGTFFTDPNDGDATVMAQRDGVPFTVTVAGQVYVVDVLFDFDTLS